MARVHPFQLLTKKNLGMADIKKQVDRVLRDARSEPRHRAARERDALITAIRYGHNQIAQRLLLEGVDPNIPDPKNRTALWYAANYASDQGSLVRELARRGALLPDDVLMGPVYDGDVETVRFLIRRSANVNCVATFTRYSNKFPQKQVVLTVAIEKVREDQVMRRSERTSDLGLTIEQRAALPLDPPSARLKSIPLMLIRAGAQVNRLAWEYSLFEGYRRTTLGLAAHYGHINTVRAMLAAGADVNLRDTWGGNALIDAAWEGHRKVVRILLEAGANAKLKRKDGVTAVLAAQQHGFTELANDIERYSKSG
jgi:ankyrin repeat protein